MGLEELNFLITRHSNDTVRLEEIRKELVFAQMEVDSLLAQIAKRKNAEDKTSMFEELR